MALAGTGSQQIYSVGADAVACTIDALTGKLQQRFKAGKHALTCVNTTPGCLQPPASILDSPCYTCCDC